MEDAKLAFETHKALKDLLEEEYNSVDFKYMIEAQTGEVYVKSMLKSKFGEMYVSELYVGERLNEREAKKIKKDEPL